MASDRTHNLKDLAAQVDRLSRLLTRDRQELPRAYLKDKGLREAYRSYFLPPNLEKIHVPLEELSLHPDGLPATQKMRVLDLGSGPGTALLGAIGFFGKREQPPQLECVAVDQVSENLAMANELYEEHRAAAGLRATLQTVASAVDGPAVPALGSFDLILLSNVLNELYNDMPDRIGQRTAFLTRLLREQLAEHGSCIIIEPALRETSRDLLLLRDGLASAGLTVFGPCLHQDACPCIADPRDWCHEDVPWEAPELVQEIDRLTGLRKDSLKFSWLVLRKDGLSLADVYDGPVFRVVSEPLVSKGKRELYLCGGGVRRLAMRQDKDRTPANEHFDRLRRGDVVRFEGLVDEGRRFRLQKETVVAPCAGRR